MRELCHLGVCQELSPSDACNLDLSSVTQSFSDQMLPLWLYKCKPQEVENLQQHLKEQIFCSTSSWGQNLPQEKHETLGCNIVLSPP